MFELAEVAVAAVLGTSARGMWFSKTENAVSRLPSYGI